MSEELRICPLRGTESGDDCGIPAWEKPFFQRQVLCDRCKQALKCKSVHVWLMPFADREAVRCEGEAGKGD